MMIIENAPAKRKARLLYVWRIANDRVFGPALEGARRYAAARSWDVETVKWREARKKTFHAPLGTVGFVVEGSDLPVDLPPRIFAGAPVVFLNCTEAPQGRRFIRMTFDNAAVSRSAFRELSANVPPAYAVVGYWRGPRHWSILRENAFRAFVEKASAQCYSFSFRESADKHASSESKRLAEWLSSLPRHCAVFAVNDDTAAVVAKSARSALLFIPRDFTLLGVDNDAMVCEAAKPSLSSIHMDFENAGFQAAKRIDELRDNLGGDRSLDVEALVAPLLAERRESTCGRGRRESRILEAVEIIRDKACDGLTAERLAARFSGSRKHFERRFREATGHSVLDEILHVRMDKVLTLLARTDTPISAISDFCGFGSAVELRRLFLDRFQTSMRQWRKDHAH